MGDAESGRAALKYTSQEVLTESLYYQETTCSCVTYSLWVLYKATWFILVSSTRLGELELTTMLRVKTVTREMASYISQVKRDANMQRLYVQRRVLPGLTLRVYTALKNSQKLFPPSHPVLKLISKWSWLFFFTVIIIQNQFPGQYHFYVTE